MTEPEASQAIEKFGKSVSEAEVRRLEFMRPSDGAVDDVEEAVKIDWHRFLTGYWLVNVILLAGVVLGRWFAGLVGSVAVAVANGFVLWLVVVSLGGVAVAVYEFGEWVWRKASESAGG